MKKTFQGLQSSIDLLRVNWKQEILSGLTVSLIALPLCLGFAMASGVPVMAGLIAAIVGGLLTAGFSGTNLTISGPAAGLIVITLESVQHLGQGDQIAGYHYTLAAIVVAGVGMFLFSLLGIGKLGDFFPSAAIHGMLAAIGIIIIGNQLFYAVGTQAHGHEFLQIIQELPDLILQGNPVVAVIAVLSLLIMAFHSRSKTRLIKLIPAPIWVLAVTIPIVHLFNFAEPHTYLFLGQTYALGPDLLVQLPSNLMEGIAFPNFEKVGQLSFWSFAGQFAIIAGMETLLISKAIDSLDPEKRRSNYGKNLGAMGVGTSISGMLGGLPIISEIVRSNANVKSGAKTKWSNFFHGLFLLIFLFFFKDLLQMIPMAALAAMLIFTGFSLASPTEFKQFWSVGKNQFLVFILTMITVLLTDILIGMVVGIVAMLILHALKGISIPKLFSIQMNSISEDETTTIILFDGVVFSNYLSFKNLFYKHLDSKKICVDFSEVRLLDHSVMNHLELLKREMSFIGTEVNWLNTSHLQPVSRHPFATRQRVKKKLNLDQRLSPRQLSLFNFAASNGYAYSPDYDLDIILFCHSLFAFGKEIKFSKNKISSIDPAHVNENQSHGLTLVDLVIEEGAQITKKYSEMTVLVLPVKLLGLPKFYLRQSDRLGIDFMNYKKWETVDLTNFPRFSRKFLLLSNSSLAVSEIFDKKLISLFMKYPDYVLDCDGKHIFIHKNRNLIPAEAIPELIEFGDEIRTTIQHRNQLILA